MNRTTRFSHMRNDRDSDGLPQVLQVTGPLAGMGNTVRKTTYTRNELIQRPAIATAGNRSKRLTNLNAVNRPLVNATTVTIEPNVNRRVVGGRAQFLPRVAKLSSNINSNTINISSNTNTMATVSTINSSSNRVAFGRSKSPLKKKSKVNSCETAMEKAALQPKQKQQQQQQQQRQQLQQAMEQEQAEALAEQMEQEEDEDEEPQVPQLQPQPLVMSNSCSSSSRSCSSSSSSSSSGSLGHSSNELRKMKLAKALQLPEEQNQSFVYLCKPVKKVKELFMVRSLRNSGENVDKGEQQAQQAQQVDYASDDVIEIDSDPLSYGSSVRCQELERELELDDEREREQELELHTHLLDVRQRQQHLLQLAEQALQTDVAESQEQLKQEPHIPSHPKIDIEMVWQNIPTLQREIKLLQQLGEKLEATLRANNPNCRLMDSDSNSNFYTPRSSMTIGIYEALPIVHLGWRREEQLVVSWQRARIACRARSIGCAREYRIETKTLTELKTADELQCFYMPLAEGGGLQRTSFRMLRENPNVLMQQLRPLTPARPFNLLEQDAMFFNSILGYGELQMASSGHVPTPPLDPLIPTRETGGGASTKQIPLGSQLPSNMAPYTRLSVRSKGKMWSTEDMKRLLTPTTDESTVKIDSLAADEAAPKAAAAEGASSELPIAKDDKKVLNDNLPRSSSWKSPKRSNHRQVTPLKTPGHDLEPRIQTQLLKTVLVGIVQVAVFLVLIMAFTYPDARC